MKRYTCHVCGYPNLDETHLGEDGKTPLFEYCPCCGVQFGYSDATLIAITRHRERWLSEGAKWFDESLKPHDWV
ncbi:hypothetical protein [Desulfitobacterium hafniense]|uniref:Uncharacterized protein n=3 Tax=root TaxID=1 RepID=A0A098B863_DESHA|nr:hypothetical protein [Desulfitobacterium hafniense]EHL06766.1 hypothetical protein HMPREF0322_02554 [Desulfitobacterium hafniense DP7]MEA5023427.1 hypothetical protein [Desulfitobacterium hafniense]CDX04036.1 Hypothetical protein DPCES_4150 [Desulfitobacterium hafniense]